MTDKPKSPSASKSDLADQKSKHESAESAKSQDDSASVKTSEKAEQVKTMKDSDETVSNSPQQAKADSESSSSSPDSASVSSSKPHFKAPDIGRLEKPARARPAIRPINWLAILLALVALLTSGWLFYQNGLQQQAWADWQKKQQQAYQAQQQLLAEARDKAEKSLRAANQANSEASALAERNQQLAESLAATQKQLRLISGRQQQDWKLAEAESLLVLAQQKLSIEKNVPVAIQLLVAADQAIASVGDVTLTDIRGLIAADLHKLKAIPQVDVSGVIATLTGVQAQLPQLKLAALEYTPVDEALKPDTTDSENTWQAIYDQFLKDFVVIKQHDMPVQPLMTPQQRFLLNAALGLQLERAKTGLLAKNQALFEDALKQASTLIAENFAVDTATSSLLETLSTLRQTPVDPLLPRELESLAGLKRENQQRLYQWLEQHSQSGSEPSREGEG